MRLSTRSNGEMESAREAEVKFEEGEMIPKSGKSPADSRKSVGIHEFAALARSSLNGISQAVRDHVTKPTSLAQGRVAHLIEWKGWPKPAGPPPGTHSQINSYSHLTEGEKEARFAAGVAEQFAIAEAKLRAWASLDDDEEEEDSNDEDANRQALSESSQSIDPTESNSVTGLTCQRDAEDAGDPPSDHPLDSSDQTCDGLATPQTALPGDCTSSFLEQEEERLEALEEQLAPSQVQRGEICIHNKPEWRPRARSSRFDSCYSTSHSESPGEDDEEEDEEGEEGSVFHEVRVWHCSPRGFFSDRASSGVASFEEEDGEEMEEKKEDKEDLK